MLTLFVVNSTGRPIVDSKIKAMTSFGDLPDKVIRVKDYTEINNIEKGTPWYGVVYDNEYIEDKLQAALRSFFELDVDMLIVYKKIATDELHIFKSPRFFKKEIKLQENSLLPSSDKNLKFEIILNGWILENDSNPV